MRRTSIGTGILLILLFSTDRVRGEDRMVFNSVWDMAIAQPSGAAGYYSPTGPNPAYWIAQWDIPGGQLPSFSLLQIGSQAIFSSAAPESTIIINRRSSTQQSYTLRQNAQYLPCGASSSAAPFESDLLINTFDVNTTAPYRPGLIGAPISISTLTHLYQLGRVKINYSYAQPSKHCPVSQGTALFAVVLNNRTNSQTLFYQLSLNRICGPNQSDNNSLICQSQIRKPIAYYYFTSNPFGLDDWLSLITGSWVTPGQTANLRVDILPRLKEMIAKAPPAMDHDFTHWEVHAAYHGQHVWGDVSMTTTWSGVNLEMVR